MSLTIGTLASSLPKPVSVTYAPTSGTVGSGDATLTYNSVPIGTAYSSRLVIAVYAFGSGKDDNAVSFISATIGGVSASSAYFVNDRTSGNNMTGAVYAIVPSGTTAQVILNFTADPGDGSGTTCCCYTIDANTLDSTTPIFSGTAAAAASITSLSVSNVKFDRGGFVLASSVTDGSGVTATWTNVTAQSSVAFEDNDRRFFTAYKVHDASSTTKTVTVGFSDSRDRRVLGVASWR